MAFIKKNILLIVILVVFAIGLGVSFFMLRNQMKVRDDLADKLSNATGDRQQLWDQKSSTYGSLSRENVKLIKANAESEKKVVKEGVDSLRRGTLSFEPVEELDGQNKVLRACRDMSELLTKSGVKHPDRFQFGFEKYSGFPPKKGDTPMIQKQLRIVAELVKLAAAAPIQELTVLKRVVFEDTAAAAATTASRGAPPGMPADKPTAPSTSSHSPVAEPMISLGAAFGIVDAPGYIYTVNPYQIEFVCDTDSLRNFLNALAQSQFILIPRVLNISNDKPGAMSGPSVSAGGAPAPTTPDRKTHTATAEPKIEEVRVDPDDLPFVYGTEKLKVGMRIDYLEIRPEPKPKVTTKPGVRGADQPTGGKR